MQMILVVRSLNQHDGKPAARFGNVHIRSKLFAVTHRNHDGRGIERRGRGQNRSCGRLLSRKAQPGRAHQSKEQQPDDSFHDSSFRKVAQAVSLRSFKFRTFRAQSNRIALRDSFSFRSFAAFALKKPLHQYARLVRPVGFGERLDAALDGLVE